MPVHRHCMTDGSVYASRTELDAWYAVGIFEPSRRAKISSARNPPALPQASLMSIYLSRWRFVLPLGLVAAALAISTSVWFRENGYFWGNPIADARFQTVTDYDGVSQAAALSRDGHFVHFCPTGTDKWTCG